MYVHRRTRYHNTRLYTNEHEAAALSFFPPTLLRKNSWKLDTAACIVDEELETVTLV